MIDRRSLMRGSSLAAAGLALPASSAAASASLPPFYAEIERRTFSFFWERADRRRGLVPDRWPTPSFCSIAAVGFALTAYPIGVERGWCSRADARDLTLATLRFFASAPQGETASGTSGYKGFFYHFLDMETGLRFRDTELSSVDTTLLFMGVLFAGAYWTGDHPAEAEIRSLSQAIYARADWAWFADGAPIVSMGWHPGRGFIARGWDGYNEGMMVLLLGLGAPDHPLPGRAWEAWCAPYMRFWQGSGTARHLAFAPLFGHQYSHVWIDFRGIRDAAMRDAGIDYFENSRRATLANRAYCVGNPRGWRGYGADIWGLTACDGPGRVSGLTGPHASLLTGYAARGPEGQPDGGIDDGTLAPTAALGSLPFAPELVVPCARAMLDRYGRRLFGRYGFLDSFNPSLVGPGVTVEKGTLDPQLGWFDDDWLGIDQGPILAMAANHRSGFVWQRMRQVPAIRRGLARAGFTGGWLAQAG